MSNIVKLYDREGFLIAETKHCVIESRNHAEDIRPWLEQVASLYAVLSVVAGN